MQDLIGPLLQFYTVFNLAAAAYRKEAQAGGGASDGPPPVEDPGPMDPRPIDMLPGDGFVPILDPTVKRPCVDCGCTSCGGAGTISSGGSGGGTGADIGVEDPRPGGGFVKVSGARGRRTHIPLWL